MTERIIEFEADGKIFFCFDGFEFHEYITRIIKFIRERINPEQIVDWGGITQYHLTFIKNDIEITYDYDSMIGNSLIIESNVGEEKRKVVKEIAEQIFTHLQKKPLGC